MDPTPPRFRETSDRAWWSVFDPRLSLRAQAALVSGGFVIVVTALVAWAAGRLVQSRLERQLSVHFESLAFQVSDKIDRAIYERAHQLEFVATLPAVRNANTTPAELRRILEGVQDTSPDFAWLGVANVSGRVLASTRGLFQGDGVAGTPWHRAAIRGRTFAGPPREIPELSLEASSPGREAPRYLDLAVPIVGLNGEAQTVLGAALKWSFARDVQHSVVPEIAGREQLGVTVYGNTQDILLDSGASGWTQPPESPAVDPRQYRGSLIENAGGTLYLTAFARSRGFKEFRGLGWLIAVRQPVELAFAPVPDLRRNIIRWGAFLSVLAIGASWMAAGSLARQIRRVTASADRIRDGDILAVMPRPPGESEIGRMCAALGDLVDDFRQKQEKLEVESRRLAGKQATETASGHDRP